MRLRGFHLEGFGLYRDLTVGRLLAPAASASEAPGAVGPVSEELPPGPLLFRGANEAGKTTLLAFLRAMLFGFPDGRRRVNPYPPLAGGRHGGRLALVGADGTSLLIERFAEPGGKTLRLLLDGREVPGEVAEEELARHLGGASRALYEAAYGFGLAELARLESLTVDGVKETLYGAGLGPAAGALPEARREVDRRLLELYRPRGSKPTLSRSLERWEALERRLRDARRALPEHEALLVRLEEVAEERREIEGRVAHLRQVERAAQDRDRWRQGHEALEARRQTLVDRHSALEAELAAEESAAGEDRGATLSVQQQALRSLSRRARRRHVFLWTLLGPLLGALVGLLLGPALWDLLGGWLVDLGLWAVPPEPIGRGLAAFAGAVAGLALAVLLGRRPPHASRVFEEEAASREVRSDTLAATRGRLRELAEQLADLEEQLAESEERGRRLEEEHPGMAETGEELEARRRELEEALERLAKEEGRLAGERDRLATDDHMERLEAEAEGLREELRQGAEEWSRWALAGEILDRARERFEAEHQPRVLARASHHLTEITGGRYRRVTAPAGGAAGATTFEVHTADGRSLPPDALSRGTAEQLYLALRIALLATRAEAAEPLPVILDDPLVNFDPARARRAARALLSLAAGGDGEARHQVLVFTCHPWMEEVFREAADGLGLELPCYRLLGGRVELGE